LLASKYLHVNPSPHPNTRHTTSALNPHSPYPPKSHGNNFEVKVISPKTSSCELHFEATKSERRTLLLRKWKLHFSLFAPKNILAQYSVYFFLFVEVEVTCASFHPFSPSFFTQNIFLRTRIHYRSAVVVILQYL